MSVSDDVSERIDKLEVRIAFQDRTIEELNTVVTEQWRVIDALRSKLQLLEDHAQAASLIADPRSEPPPPHY